MLVLLAAVPRDQRALYILDTRKYSRLITYDDLFTSWEKVLKFQIQGKDAPEERERKAERKRDS
jgi:hypothetical protein